MTPGQPTRLLVVNAGSSTLKLALLDGDELVRTTKLEHGADGFEADALREFVGDASVDAVGHRVVHGGTRFLAAVVIEPDVRQQLEDLCELAPLHQPGSLAGIDAAAKALPDVPAVACFDTSFHSLMPPGASTYAVPLDWREEWGVRRYGFHGLSHAYCSRRAAAMLGRTDDPDLHVVVCHLGAGASLSAVRGGRSVDTTMGFTPLEGLAMATRSGSVDPALVLWLQQQRGLSAADVADALEHRSGLLGLAGTADMREVLQRISYGDEIAELALVVYVHRVVSGVGAMTASMGGLDALVFTGGVGEGSHEVRRAVADRLGVLGVAVDVDRNAAAAPDSDVTGADADVRVLVVKAREDLQIAAETRALLASTT